MDRDALIRVVARQLSELLLARHRRWFNAAPHESISVLVFEVVVGDSLAQQPYRRPDGGWIGLEDAPALGRPVRATAIATSMQLPPTTVRNNTATLVSKGLLVRESGGFRPTEAFFSQDSFPAMLQAEAADVAAAVTTLAAAGFAPAEAALAAGVVRLPPGVVARQLLSFALKVLENFTQLHGEAILGTITAAIVAANVRHITEDPQLSLQYARETTLPPDDLRRPISIRALAKSLDVPFETVRRRVAGLIAVGDVEQWDGGVVIPGRVLRSDRYIQYNRRTLLHFEQMLEALRGLAAAGGAAER